ncbi:MAG: 4-hydroxythreonine-4-phosphate dehydrogenase PdxA [Bacteriovoracia bacterium]
MLPVGITTGDHKGIGPEVISKGLARCNVSSSSFVIFGDTSCFTPFRNLFKKPWNISSEAEFLDPNWKLKKNMINFVVPDKCRSADNACGRYIELATHGVLKKKLSSICTGPIDKTALRKGGYQYNGHTDMLEDLTRSTVTMLLAGNKMKVSLVTTHIPLNKVSGSLSKKNICLAINNTITGLKDYFRIRNPRIAVLGLNPHAGDSGLFGNEEKKIILPAISLSKKNNPNNVVEGPFAPDGFFAQWTKRHSKKFDAIVCMYHDQGLIPIKLIDFEDSVNITLGLPFLRTSVDHGTGFDIAGKNMANAGSFISAFKLAYNYARKHR